MSAENQQQEGASTFEPIHPFDMTAPKTWAGTIGMMHWDNDKIVFSKRSLLEFMKSCDVTVNTNFTEIQKLPKYATFGHFSQALTDAAVADLVDVRQNPPVPALEPQCSAAAREDGEDTADTQAEIADPTTDNKVHPNKSTVPRPTRKVVDPPGGKQNLRIFGEEYEETDALSLAPPRGGGDGIDVEVERMERMRLHVEPQREDEAHIEEEKDSAAERASNPPPNFRPTRKVREGPGGKSSMGQALFGGYEDETDADRQEAVNSQGRKKQQPQSSGGNLW